MEIKWKDSPHVVEKSLSFSDLNFNDTFRILGSQAVYVKCQVNAIAKDYMYEIATGKLYDPTSSTVELIGVSVYINVPKPRLYKNLLDDNITNLNGN